MLSITPSIKLAENEVKISSIRAQGSGGQNVNKVATAIHLRFDILASSLPLHYKHRLMALKDQRISKQGVIIIKGQQFRTREKNLQDAISRLIEIIRNAGRDVKPRRPTKPTKSSQLRRLNNKTRHSQTKVLRRRIDID